MSEAPKIGLRSVVVVLIVSLCVNLLLAGVLVAFFWRAETIMGRPGDAWPPPPKEQVAGKVGRHGGFGAHGVLNPRVLMQVAPEKTAEIRVILDAHREKMKALRQNATKARQNAADVLADGRYSSQAFAQTLQAVRLADTALEEEILNIVAQIADTLSPQERQAVKEKLRQQRMPQGDGPQRGDDRGNGRGDGFGPGMGDGPGMGRHGRHGGPDATAD